MRLVYAFDEEAPGGRDLLGGKGVGLAEIREERVRSMGGPRRRYADLEVVFEELEAATRIHRRLRCPVIDVSELSVEETAMRIIRLVADRHRRRETASA